MNILGVKFGSFFASIFTSAKLLGIFGSKEKTTQIFHNEFMTLGSILATQNAWLMLRSLQTLPIRLKQLSETTLKILDYLHNSDKIERICYPFSNDNPQV
jgi:cystathionine beta-lyase/cystathionine gamma-synthase